MFDYTPSPSLSTQLCEPETLHDAWRKVRSNKGNPGIDGVTIQQFEVNLTKHLRQLSRELTEDRYYPLPVQKFTIKKSNGTTRELSVLTLKDRIVQRAVCDLIKKQKLWTSTPGLNSLDTSLTGTAVTNPFLSPGQKVYRIRSNAS